MRDLIRLAMTGILAAALCWPAAAGAATRAQRQYFKATFTASQQQTWTQNQQSTGCNTTVTSQGGGSSRLRLRTPRSFYVVAVRARRIAPLMMALGHARGFRVTGTYFQDGSITVTSSGGTGCGDGGTSAPKDCGDRALSGYVGLRYLTPRNWPSDPAPLRPSILPTGPQPGSSSGQLHSGFRNCPGGGGDALIESAGGLTTARLFGRLRKLTVRGRGSEVQSSGGNRSTTTTTWTLTLTRISRAPVLPPWEGSVACADFADNDGDRRVDFEDPGCRRSAGRTETG
jgi:hypothetical protein